MPLIRSVAEPSPVVGLARPGDAVPRKQYLRGTHRAIAPAETLARFSRHASRMGITRLAEVTGLDYLGIPVFMACRPNARSLSVSQGKGLDRDAARASGFMEAAELYHAEHVDLPVRWATRIELARRREVVDLKSLPRLRGGRLTERTELPWIEARDLFGGGAAWIPYDLVHADYSEPRSPSCRYFPVCSNGLASGNHVLEATCAALCEVIERDATTLWWLRSSDERARRRLNLESVDETFCRALLDQLHAARMLVSVWDATSDVGVATFVCRLREAPDNPNPHQRAFYGFGSHLSRAVALSRAITEAVQTRLTFISGGRDDLERSEFGEPLAARILDLAVTLVERQMPARAFAEVPDGWHEGFAADLDGLLLRLRSVGIDRAYVVDLTKPDLGIPVVRVFVPGLEYIDDMPGYVLGPRARRMRDGVAP